MPRTSALQHAAQLSAVERSYVAKYPGESGTAIRAVCPELLDRVATANAQTAASVQAPARPRRSPRKLVIHALPGRPAGGPSAERVSAMPSTVFDSAIFRDAFGSPAMRAVFSDDAAVARYVEVEVALAAAEGQSSASSPKRPPTPSRGCARADGHRPGQAQGRDRPRRLSDRRRRAPARQAVRRCRPLRALGRHHPGHHGHRHCPADPRRAGTRRGGPRRRSMRRWPRWPRSTATTVMAGRTHLQHALPVTFGYKAAVWLGMVVRHRQRLEGIEAARAGRPVRRRRRHAGLARRQGSRRARRADGRAAARPAADRLARGPRRPGGDRRLPRPRRPARSPRSPPTSC